ncbi:MAG: S-layer homology domain-containing protein [Clostridia bacterium]|nr:S-layer homology domain-containing protein [Clostridia bacterium]
MKKGLTLLLAVVMLMASAVANVSAASFADTEGQNCETAVNVLSSLGIVEGKEEGAYAPQDSLTRAEMVTIILRLMNMEGTASGVVTFEDVPSSHWAYGNIGAAYQMGIVNGTSATTFNPDDAVTYEQAVKMVVSALGYSVQADAAGGYPTGYLSKAAQLDILTGVTTGGEMSRGSMANLVYNALDVELFLKTIYGDDAYEYATDETKTILSHYLKITKITDTVTGTYLNRIGSPATRRLLEDEVSVGSLILKAGETNASDFFGIRSDIYYKKDADSDVSIIQAITARASASVIDVKAQDIVPGATTTSLFVYEDENGKEEEVAIAGATLVYNGREAAKDMAHLVPENGTVRLVMEGTDCKTIIVEAYRNFVVDSVIVDDKDVYFKDNVYSVSNMVIDLSDNSIPTTFTDVQGLPIDVVDLAEWDIMSIAVSEGTTDIARRICRSYDSVTGTVTEVSDDEVIIDDKAYSVSPSVADGTITLGQTAQYYLDYTGAIAAVDTSVNVSRSYAWLTTAATSKGLNGEAQIRAFDQSGEWKVFSFAEKVKFNGVSTDRNALLTPAENGTNSFAYSTAPTLMIEGADGTAEVIPQLIAYKTNEEGLITDLETAVNMTRLNYTDDQKFGGDFSMDFYQNDNRRVRGFNNTKAGDATDNPGDYVVEYSGGLVFTRVYANNNTMFFKIPKDTADEKQYSVGGANTQGLSLEPYRTWKCISFYDVNESHQCGAMVMRYDMSNDAGEGATYPNYGTSAALITSITKVLTEDGEAATSLKMINSNGKEVATTITDDEFEVLYKAANSDAVNDTAWYKWVTETDPDTGLPKKVKKYNSDRNLNYVSSNKRIEMFMDPDALVPGDVIQYELEADGSLGTASVLYRINHPGNVEFSTNAGGISAQTTKDTNYRGGNLLINGTIKKKLENGLLVSVNIGNTYGADTNLDAERILPNTGKFVIWNAEKQTATLATAADVVQEDTVLSFWQTTTQKMVVIYR